MVKLLSTSWWMIQFAGESLHMTRVVNVWGQFHHTLVVPAVVRIHRWTQIEIDRMRSVATFQFRFHKRAVRWKYLVNFARIVEMRFPPFANQIAIETNRSISNIAKLKPSFCHSFSGWIGMRPGWEGRDSELITGVAYDRRFFCFFHL